MKKTCEHVKNATRMNINSFGCRDCPDQVDVCNCFDCEVFCEECNDFIDITCSELDCIMSDNVEKEKKEIHNE